MNATTVIALNVSLWPAIQLGIARLAVLAPDAWFAPERRIFILGRRESRSGFYAQVFMLRHWRPLLPDGAPWVGGRFSKRRIVGGDRAFAEEFREEFRRETCRGESAHWVMLAFTPIFFLWNPWWADAVMVGYALASNVPCIISQRRLRAGLTRLARRDSRRRSPMSDGKRGAL